MRLEIVVTLDGGGEVTIKGENLGAKDVFEVFGILASYTVQALAEADDLDQE